MNKTIKKIIAVLLKLVAKLILWRHKPIVIGITGSVGKTTTKDAIAHGLSSVEHIQKTQKNYNNDYGVPLSIIGAENPWGSTIGWLRVVWQGIEKIFDSEYPKVLVLEVGTRFPGDIARISKWLRPNIAVLTHIPEIPPHIEFFESVEHLVDEKSALVKYLQVGGTVILNRDSERVYNISKNTAHKVITIGFHPESDVRAQIIMYKEHGGRPACELVIYVDNQEYHALVPGVIADHQLYGILYAAAAAHILGYSVYDVINSFKELPVTPGRLSPLIGIKESLLIDDSYNASPDAMKEALKSLSSLSKNSSRSIAVLGDMFDLGKMTEDAHNQIGEVLKNYTTHAVLVGPRMERAYNTALDKKFPKTRITHFNTPTEAGDFLAAMIKKGDVVLVKGSQGIRMEKVLEKIIRDQHMADTLLVRQDEAWKRK